MIKLNKYSAEYRNLVKFVYNLARAEGKSIEVSKQYICDAIIAVEDEIAYAESEAQRKFARLYS